MNEGGGSSTDLNTILLLHGNSLTDVSGTGSVITSSNVTAGSGGKFGRGQLYFNGNAFLRLNSFALSTTKPYTVDFWVNYDTNTGTASALIDTYGSYSGGVILRRDTTKFTFTRSTVADDAYYQEAMVYGTWIHIAMTFDGNTYKVFENGTLIISVARNTSSMDYLSFGRNYFYSNWSDWRLKGYISELRVSDVVRWTTSFTPPTKAY